MRLPEQALQKAVLIVAHPDDEVLWFATIVERVQRVIVCFQSVPGNPALTAARERSLAAHPLGERILSLDLAELDSFNGSNWPEPRETEYGLELSARSLVDGDYAARATELRDRLRPYLSDVCNIYTHSPWGEYGHEDHVQVHRVCSHLAQEIGASLWFSNYASNKSISLMNRYLDDQDTTCYCAPVDRDRARQIAATYKETGAWTWMDGYQWFDTECFVAGPLRRRSTPGPIGTLPLNYLRIPFVPPAPPPRPAWLDTPLLRRLRAIKRRLMQRSSS